MKTLGEVDVQKVDVQEFVKEGDSQQEIQFTERRDLYKATLRAYTCLMLCAVLLLVGVGTGLLDFGTANADVAKLLVQWVLAPLAPTSLLIAIIGYSARGKRPTLTLEG